MQPAATGPSALDWVSAIAHVAGAFRTLTAVVVALWVASRDGRRLQTELSDREKGQARLIFADVHEESGRWWVRTTNHSAAPVFTVEVVEVRHQGGTSGVEAVPGAPAVLDVLEPGADQGPGDRAGWCTVVWGGGAALPRCRGSALAPGGNWAARAHPGPRRRPLWWLTGSLGCEVI